MTELSATDIASELQHVVKHWTPRVVGQVNDQYIKVAKLLGELVWHSHDDEDEMFFVVPGNLRIEIEGCEDARMWSWGPASSTSCHAVSGTTP
jgi:mannose-6-phosphate isomerase-like protein (cupin superfamily)